MMTLRAKIIAAAMLLAAIVGLTLFAWHEWTSAGTAKAEATLAKGQSGAAIESGKDAVGTISDRIAADQAGDNTVQETKDAINNAGDAASVDRAGRSGLCGLAGYRSRPECVR